MAVLVGSVTADPVIRLADRVIALASGLLVYDGPPAGFTAARA